MVTWEPRAGLLRAGAFVCGLLQKTCSMWDGSIHPWGKPSGQLGDPALAPSWLGKPLR